MILAAIEASNEVLTVVWAKSSSFRCMGPLERAQGYVEFGLQKSGLLLTDLTFKIQVTIVGICTK